MKESHKDVERRHRRRPFGDQLAFLQQWRQEFQATGAVMPSSRFLARAITKPLGEHDRPVRVLEVGPGTGAVTRRIVELMQPDDRLDMVELNDKFVEILERKFQADPVFRAAADRAEIHACAVQDFESDGRYDYIISGLPLNNFPAPLVREIFEVCFGMLAPGGVLSYFEYMFVRRFRRVLSGNDERNRLSELDEVLGGYLARHRIRTAGVMANCPPAWVYHLRGDDEATRLANVPAQ